MPEESTKGDVLESLGLAELSTEEQEDALATLGDLVFKESLVRLIERMDDATKDAFDALLARDASEDEMMAFLEKNVPGAEEAVEGAVAEVAGDILGENLPDNS